MPNLTRNPFHKNTGTYITNMGKLNIWVGGQKLDSQFVVNIYYTAHQRQSYVQVFKTKDGKIVETSDSNANIKPVVEDIEGAIEVTGPKPKHCGCWSGRRIKYWWRKLHDHGNRNW